MGLEKPKFKENGSYNSPENIDYDVLGFHKKRLIVKGELILVEYYRNYDGVTYSDLILDETRTYFRNGIGLIQHRSQNVRWYLEDNTIGCEKITMKYYSSSESIDEGITRRNNIINDAKIYALGTIGQAYGFDLMNSLKTQIDLYVQGYTQPLKDGVNTSTKPYLTQANKDALVVILTF